MDEILQYVAQLKPSGSTASPASIERQLQKVRSAIEAEGAGSVAFQPPLAGRYSQNGSASAPAAASSLQRPRRWRRGLVAAVTATGVLAGGGAAAAVLLQPDAVTNRSIARCYSVASLSGGRNFRGSDVASIGPSGSSSARQSALEACSLLWENGFLVAGAPHALHLPGGVLTQHPVPPLVVCTLPGGIAGVFPGDSSTCQELGLPLAPSA